MKWRILAAVIVFAGVVWFMTRKTQAAELDEMGDDDIMRTPSRSLDEFARAIAKAEGFGVVGAIPTRANNPGDLARGDKGLGTLGSEKITIFESAQDGWVALWSQLDLIARGKSKYYTPDMTIAQMARVWTSTEQSAWGSNVAKALNVSTSAVISQWIGDYR